jgi:Trk-type K+ transport system membrane component
MLENKKDYFQFIFNCYRQTGLRRSSTFFHKSVALYVLYPSLITFYFMVIFNLRYKHSDISDFAEIFSSISTFGNVGLLRF